MKKLVTAFVFVLTASSFGAEPVRVGFAERDISPALGVEQPGGYGKSFHKVFHDPCKVRVAVFDDGKSRVALVGVDALMVQRSMVVEARKAISEKCGIVPQAVLIAASHTHSGGPTGMILPGDYDHGSDLVKELAYKLSSNGDVAYNQSVRDKIVEAVVEADAGRKPLLCGFGTGDAGGVAFNRRIRMKNGLTFTHPGQGNPDSLDYAGPTDPTVGVIGAWDEKGKLIGCVVNFACHCTTGPGGVSADYVYYIEKVLRGAFEPDTVVVFLNGASGDITQVDNLCAHTKPFFGAPSSQLVGATVGAEAVKALVSIPRGAEVPLAAAAKVLDIPRRVPNPQRVAAAHELVNREIKSEGKSADWVWAKETVLLDALLKKEPVAQAEVQAVQVGPAVFVTTPAEYFCQYGLDIKKGSKFPFTYPVSLANGCVGYVPTEEALGEKGGGYETRLTSYSNLRVTAGTELAHTGIELTKDFTPGPVPLWPPAPKFGGAPWSYGNAPPQRE